MGRAHDLLRRNPRDLKIVNLGLELFFQSLRSQGVRVYHVRQPVRRLEKDLEDILSKI